MIVANPMGVGTAMLITDRATSRLMGGDAVRFLLVWMAGRVTPSAPDRETSYTRQIVS
jgi:hypothetical protein